MSDMKPQFEIGTKFTNRTNRKDICTVTDILTTRNSKDEVVRIRYVATHEFMGQTVTNNEVPQLTIARGIIY